MEACASIPPRPLPARKHTCKSTDGQRQCAPPRAVCVCAGDSVELLLFLGAKQQPLSHQQQRKGKGQRRRSTAPGPQPGSDKDNGHSSRPVYGYGPVGQPEPGPAGLSGPSLTLKVNGKVVDVLHHLPPVPMAQWVWYCGLWTGGDMSAALFARDSYAVCWGDYVVKRYL